MTRKLQTLVLGAIVATMALGGTASAQYGGGLNVSPSSVAPGGSLTVQGEGFEGGAQIALSLRCPDPVSLGSVAANSSGSFSTTVQIPSSVEEGSCEVVARGPSAGGDTLVLSTTITVVGAGGSGAATFGGTAPGGALAATGMDAILLGSIAIGMIAVGVALVISRRRRPQES